MIEAMRTSRDIPRIVPSALLCTIDRGYSWSNLCALRNALRTCAILDVGFPTSLSVRRHSQAPFTYDGRNMHTGIRGILNREHILLLLACPAFRFFGEMPLRQHRHDESGVVEVETVILEEA